MCISRFRQRQLLFQLACRKALTSQGRPHPCMHCCSIANTPAHLHFHGSRGGCYTEQVPRPPERAVTNVTPPGQNSRQYLNILDLALNSDNRSTRSQEGASMYPPSGIYCARHQLRSLETLNWVMLGLKLVMLKPLPREAPQHASRNSRRNFLHSTTSQLPGL